MNKCEHCGQELAEEKDELFEKWCNFLEWFDPEFANSGGPTIKTNFEKAKSLGLLKDPKDKVIALNKAIEFYQKWEIDNPGGKIPVYGLINYLFGIRSKYTPEAE